LSRTARKNSGIAGASRRRAAPKSYRPPNDTTRRFPKKTVKLERLEGQAFDLADQDALFLLSDEVRAIAKAGRRRGVEFEEVKLVSHLRLRGDNHWALPALNLGAKATISGRPRS
jgi:hypothetical protein